MTTFPVPGGATFMKAVNNLSDVANPATALANLGGLGLVATTGVNGFALQNATPNILTWTAPNDGQLHRLVLFSTIHVTAAETGGLVQFDYMPFPGSPTHFGQVFAAGLATDTTGQIGNSFNVFTAAGSTVTMTQASALTVGAATLWAEIWAL